MALTYGFNLDETGKEYTAAQFTEAFYHFGGDCVSAFGGAFGLTLDTHMSFQIAPGYAYVNGCWLKSTGYLTFTLERAETSADRYDAVAIVVDQDSRTASIEVLTDIDPDNPTRDDTVYTYYLYTISVTRRITILSESLITDCRGSLLSMDDLESLADEAYTFATSGLDAAISDLQDTADDAVDTAQAGVSVLAALVDNCRATYVGDLKEAVNAPSSNWLECDGSTVPAAYTDLITLIGSTLPNISSDDSRLTIWMYGGEV